ncbi:hypothetical protein TEA_021535 [Camellia sinensis var. sinensis]|uniref:Acyl-CoA dehydrogenase/oxidase C-terminal domain-containing protein n=1 Tax=Camellia sinensis var. sinensis TaxID=542762 RepID=A0A4V3WQ55_CAMSN|nr:hypothetical protein TEA_021535 [Camellia sinensis var. sinensis]
MFNSARFYYIIVIFFWVLRYLILFLATPINITSAYSICFRFLVKKDAPGLQATKIENKIGLRMVQNGDILLKKVFVPDEDKLPGITSFRDTNKAWISLKARETVALGRELLGGNGILTDFHVAKAFCDLEPTYTGEGTYDINTLVTGREITGISSFKVAALTQQSRL